MRISWRNPDLVGARSEQAPSADGEDSDQEKDGKIIASLIFNS